MRKYFFEKVFTVLFSKELIPLVNNGHPWLLVLFDLKWWIMIFDNCSIPVNEIQSIL